MNLKSSFHLKLFSSIFTYSIFLQTVAANANKSKNKRTTTLDQTSDPTNSGQQQMLLIRSLSCLYKREQRQNNWTV